MSSKIFQLSNIFALVKGSTKKKGGKFTFSGHETCNIKKSPFKKKVGKSWKIFHLGHNLSVVAKLPPIGITEVFSRLHCSPEILAKCFRIDIQSLKYSGFLLTNMLVSSAKVSVRDSFLA